MNQRPITVIRFRLRGFRSCKDTELNPTQNVTALIGPNGSGKTNLLQGLSLLRGEPDRSKYYWREKDSSALRCEIEADFKLRRRIIQYRASVIFRPNDVGREDVLDLNEEWNLRRRGRRSNWTALSPYGRFFARRSEYSDDRVYFRNPTRLRARSGRKISKNLSDAIWEIKNFCTRISYYTASQFTNPSQCPTSFEIDEDNDLVLSATNPGDHQKFIYNLYVIQHRRPEQYASFLNLVGRGGLHLIDDIKWKPVKFPSQTYEVKSGGRLINRKGQRTLVVPTIHIGSARLSFNQLSEGTFRTLALLFHVITDRSTILLLEEPEVCVHHGLLNSVIEVIKSFSQSKQIIFSTHSEAVVDLLEPDQVRLVSISPRKGTVVAPISESLSAKNYEALKDYLTNTGSLGEYWRTAGFSE
jgi:predicted ATP-dependent endonuclease of OLD family